MKLAQLWVELGEKYDEFWRRTPAEFGLIVSAKIKAKKHDRNMMRALVYAGAQLVAVGVNNPKKFPKPDDFLKEKNRKVATSLDEQRAALARFARKTNGP